MNQQSTGKIYLIPTVLHEDEKALHALPAYITEAVKDCQVFFVENEKTTRRFFKKLWKEMVIDDYEWYPIHKAEAAAKTQFAQCIKQQKNIGIVSEAGCPGVADPGQLLIAVAQEMHATVVPLVGPSSILLALMASGMNGQSFQFVGYLPIDDQEKKKAIKELEEYSAIKNCTQLFIETPYRNNQLFKTLLATCRNETKICIAADITGANESIQTKTVKEWKQVNIDIHKKLVIFLLYAG
ncbi:SAM-dependent methyltransferase [Panacibacter sp. DH6]|uniref:SAM-dependent methyltransferase n=1 Tax=Panacibacter microcysteis TaxID=2793269 RepID=A0A931H087_9BACT|nr:SAM-dependent methyltransferase [Panacibacter microcysteis]MBG9378604.1 SAM-dependent methyltransferase [Panacibacter microcysteis]